MQQPPSLAAGTLRPWNGWGSAPWDGDERIDEMLEGWPAGQQTLPLRVPGGLDGHDRMGAGSLSGKRRTSKHGEGWRHDA